MEKKIGCEFQDRCIKNHQDAGEMGKIVHLKILGDERTKGYVCGFITAGTVLGCPRRERYSEQTEGEGNGGGKKEQADCEEDSQQQKTA